MEPPCFPILLAIAGGEKIQHGMEIADSVGCEHDLKHYEIFLGARAFSPSSRAPHRARSSAPSGELLIGIQQRSGVVIMKNSGFSILSCNALSEALIDIAAKSVSFAEDVFLIFDIAATSVSFAVNLKDEELVNLSQRPYGN